MNWINILFACYIVFESISKRLDRKYIFFAIIIIVYHIVSIMQIYLMDGLLFQHILYFFDKAIILSLAYVLYIIFDKGAIS